MHTTATSFPKSTSHIKARNVPHAHRSGFVVIPAHSHAPFSAAETVGVCLFLMAGTIAVFRIRPLAVTGLPPLGFPLSCPSSFLLMGSPG